MLELRLTEEQYLMVLDDLLFALTRETEQQLPSNLTIKQKRWLLDGLFEVRSTGDLDKSLITMQDKLLSYENFKRGVEDCGKLKTKNGLCFFDKGFEQLKVDVCVLFAPSLIVLPDEQTDTEKNLMLAAGLQLKEDFAITMQEFHNVLPTTKIYVSSGYNLPCKKVAKILVHAKENNLAQDYACFNTAIKELFEFLKINQFKSVAFDTKALNEYDPALFEILKREIKNNKKIKIIVNF